jgi:hemolysin III
MSGARVKGELQFPDYSQAERRADAVVHCIGVPLGVVAAIWLVARVAALGQPVMLAGVVIYGLGIVGMLGASAAYQMTRPGLLKERLRRVDRAMIFVMIAGTYTPISATVLFGRHGLWLCGLLWGLAGIGIFLTLKFPRRFERAILGLYLAMGWMLVVLIRDCMAVLPVSFIALILAGGVAYTVGAVIQAQPKIKFHNPIWHTLILLAASLQYAAISLQLTGAVF